MMMTCAEFSDIYVLTRMVKRGILKLTKLVIIE